MNMAALSKGIDAGVDTVNKIAAPIGTIGTLVNNKKTRELKQKELDENRRQFDISSLLKKREMLQSGNQFDRTAGMSAINMLANQRASAMQQFGNQKLKDSFFMG